MPLKRLSELEAATVRGCVCVHLACIFHEETQNSRISYVHMWRHITHALGTLIASKDP